MGGLGSGKRCGHGQLRPVVEDFLSIDILDFNKQGLLKPGSVFKIFYSVNKCDVGFVSISIGTESLYLNHKIKQVSRKQEVKLTNTSCNYGGSRTWLCCGQCDSNRNSLYLSPEGHWACRQCLGLAYKVQRLNPHQRHSYMAQKIKQKKLNIAPENSSLSIERPFRMWRKKYINILDQVFEHEQLSHNIFISWFDEIKRKNNDLTSD